jgi:hypothetical protein
MTPEELSKLAATLLAAKPFDAVTDADLIEAARRARSLVEACKPPKSEMILRDKEGKALTAEEKAAYIAESDATVKRVRAVFNNHATDGKISLKTFLDELYYPGQKGAYSKQEPRFRADLERWIKSRTKDPLEASQELASDMKGMADEGINSNWALHLLETVKPKRKRAKE